MNEDTMFETTAIIDIDEQLRKEEELMNTIKMEPILEKTFISEEPLITKKEKRIKITDCILISLIVVISTVFLVVVLNG